MTRMLNAVLITLGDPDRLTGGYLYHRRMAELAPGFGAALSFASFPDMQFPLAALTAPSVLRAANEYTPDVLVLDSIAGAFLGPWLALLPPRMPVVGMLHQPAGGIDHGRVRTLLQTRLDLLAYRHTASLLVASEPLARGLARQGVDGASMTVVPPGRDVAAQVERPAADLRRGRRAALLCVGNWQRRKGIHSLLEATALLPEESATLHLVGDTDVEPDYSRRLREQLEGLGSRVVVHGRMSREQVAGMYAGADVFVLPSLREPYGTVYGEAMAYGLPVVGWAAGNLPYLAEHGREGLALPPGDVPALASALAGLVEDVALRERMARAALRRAGTRPTWEESAERFFGALRQAVGASTPHAGG